MLQLAVVWLDERPEAHGSCRSGRARRWRWSDSCWTWRSRDRRVLWWFWHSSIESASPPEVLGLMEEAAEGIHVPANGSSLPVGNGSRARLGFVRRQKVA